MDDKLPALDLDLHVDKIVAAPKILRTRFVQKEPNCGQIVTMSGSAFMHKCDKEYEPGSPDWTMKTTGPGIYGYMFFLCKEHANAIYCGCSTKDLLHFGHKCGRKAPIDK